MTSTKVEIEFKNLSKNVNYLNQIIDKEVEVLAVVKANAYGHGSVEITKALIELGVDRFAVATLKEARELIDAKIQCYILILGSISESEILEAVKNDIIFTIYDLNQLNFINSLKGETISFHLKVDTGMNRLGIDVDQIDETIRIIANNSNLNLEGVYTHFAESEKEESNFTKGQIREFNKIIEKYKSSIKNIKFFHMANSSGIINYPDSHLNMVRPGILMYGLAKNPGDKLSPVMRLKSLIIKIRNIDKGETVSYGRDFTAEKDMKIAVIPIGYADGLPRFLSNKGCVFHNGRQCRIVGTICMDLTMIDVTECADAKVGDEVIIFDDSLHTANDIALAIKTIPYEIVCGISKRIKRVYL
jgi:alanine racemase|tara:strand:- start:61 stop:1140 length:1080 start_codon:yes stop_codon:yes gene_type:complete